MPGSGDVGDLFVVRSALVPMTIAVLAGTILSFYGFSALVSSLLATFPFLGVWVGYMLLTLLGAASHESWREMASRTVIVLCIWPSLFYLYGLGGDYVHLAIMYPSYLSKTGIIHQTEVRFDWDDARFVGIDYQRVLVFDPSDRIIQENTAQSSENIAPPLIRHLLGHFYLILEIPAY